MDTTIDRLEMHWYIINIFTGASARNGFEIYRQLCIRCSVPLGTKSIGEHWSFHQAVEANNLEESFSQWEFELNKFKPYNWQVPPRLVKWQSYRVRQEWPLQEHLLSGQAPTYAKVKTTSMEYILQSHNSIYKTQTEVVKRKRNLGGGLASMDISAIKGKWKDTRAEESKEKEKEKETKGTKESR